MALLARVRPVVFQNNGGARCLAARAMREVLT